MKDGEAFTVNSIDHGSRRRAAIAVFVFVVAANFLFLSVIAHLEPIGDDGWDIVNKLKTKVDNRPGPSYLFDDFAWRYINRNPRVGEFFTNLNYWPYHTHEIVTPTMIVLLFLCVFVLAVGRFPRLTSFYDSFLLIMVTALCWLSIPDVGVAFFSRPITGNYTIGACLQLLFFIPLRLWVDYSKRPALNVSFSILMFFGGVVAGMANEHTGPMAILVFAVMAVYTTRKRERRIPLWAISGWLGLVAGYLALFFAPGQTRRYQGLATETTLVENILARGWAGNLEIVGDFMAMLLPLLVAVTVMAYAFVIHDHGETGGLKLGDSRRRFLGIGFLVACAFGIVATTLVSPLVNTRLFIAPMMVLIIAGVIFTDIVSRPKKLARFFLLVAVIVISIHFSRVFVIYRIVNSEFLERVEILRNAEPGSVARVPFYSHKYRGRFYIGDDFKRKYAKAQAARYFGLERIETYPRPEPHPDS